MVGVADKDEDEDEFVGGDCGRTVPASLNFEAAPRHRPTFSIKN